MKRFDVFLLVVCSLFVSIVPTNAFAKNSDRTLQLLRTLSKAHGPPSGLEEPVRKIMVQQMKPFADGRGGTTEARQRFRIDESSSPAPSSTPAASSDAFARKSVFSSTS